MESNLRVFLSPGDPDPPPRDGLANHNLFLANTFQPGAFAHPPGCWNNDPSSPAKPGCTECLNFLNSGSKCHFGVFFFGFSPLIFVEKWQSSRIVAFKGIFSGLQVHLLVGPPWTPHWTPPPWGCPACYLPADVRDPLVQKTHHTAPQPTLRGGSLIPPRGFVFAAQKWAPPYKGPRVPLRGKDKFLSRCHIHKSLKTVTDVMQRNNKDVHQHPKHWWPKANAQILYDSQALTQKNISRTPMFRGGAASTFFHATEPSLFSSWPSGTWEPHWGSLRKKPDSACYHHLGEGALTSRRGTCHSSAIISKQKRITNVNKEYKLIGWNIRAYFFCIFWQSLYVRRRGQPPFVPNFRLRPLFVVDLK